VRSLTLRNYLFKIKNSRFSNIMEYLSFLEFRKITNYTHHILTVIYSVKLPILFGQCSAVYFSVCCTDILVNAYYSWSSFSIKNAVHLQVIIFIYKT
jgi:hypothetical protein